MQRVMSILKALRRNQTTSRQGAFSSRRQVITLLVAIVAACLMTGASSATQRSRRIIFEINVDEPRPGFVLQVQRELVGRGGPVNLTRAGNKFIGEYIVPDTLRENIGCRLLIQIDDPVQPWLRLQYRTNMDFTRPDSPDFKIERHFRFFPLQIEAVERDARGVEQPCFPDVGFYRRTGDQRERILYTGVQSDSFRSGRGMVDTFFFSETFLQPIGTEIQVHGVLTVPGTFNNNAIASFIVPRTGAARVRLVFYAWQTAIRRAVRDALRNAGISQANAETISEVPINGVAGVAFAEWRPLRFPFNWTSWSNYQIALNGGFNLLDLQGGDSLMHEFTHETLYQMSWQPTAPPNIGHDIEVPASLETQAWEEGLCHFIGTHLLTRIVEKQTPIGYTGTAFWIDATNDRVRERAVANRNQPSLNSPARTVMQNPGNWIEGVVTGSLLELYYEQGINPQTDPEGVLKAFIADLRDFCAAVPQARWTVEEFFRHRAQNPRGRIPLFESRVVDQIALWYLLTTRGQVRDVDRLVPVILRPSAAATVKTGEVVELRASARAFHRLVGQYRAYGGPSLRARLYEGTRQIGTDVPLDQSSIPNYSAAALLAATFNDLGAHRVRAEIWGDFIDGTMERLGISDEVEITVEKKDESDKTKAEARYNWLQQCVPYLEELIRLDEQEYTRLERAVHAEILKRVNEGQYPLGLSDSERQRMEQFEREFASRPAGRIQKIRDPLTGEERLGYVQTGAPLTEAEKQKGLELARLKAKADPAYAIVHYEFECLEKALEERMTHKRDLKGRLEALKDSKAYKYFAEFKAYNDYKGYLKEVVAIEAILKLPMPLPKPPKLPWAYSAPCASPPVGPTVGPFDVTLVATPANIAPGAITRIAANVRGGKAPFSYAWTGHTSGQGATVSLTSTVPGDRQVSVTVTDATGRTTNNTIKITVTALEVILEKLAPSGNDVVFGSSGSFAAKVVSGGKPVSGNYVYRWQPHPEVKFTPPEGNQATAAAIFLRPGKVTLWVSVLENRQGQLVTLAESKPLELMVTPPVFEVAFDKAAPYIGEETRAKVILRQPIPPDRIAFKWEATPNAKLVGEAQDAREIVFLPSNDAPLTVTVRASVPFYGDSLGEKSATLQAKPYEVRAITVSRPPFSVENNVELMATIKPDTAKKPVRFLWSVAPDSNNHIVGQEAGKTVTINRSATGMCAIELEAFDGNGFRIGKDTTSFHVTITPERPDKTIAKTKIETLLKQGAELHTQKKYAEAIVVFDEAINLDPGLSEAWRQRGMAKRELKDYRSAITDFTRAIELNPNNSQAFSGRGIARERNNDVAGALADYTRAIQLNPRYENAYSYRGHLRIEQKDYSGAKADYDEVLALNPKNQIAWNNRGVAKERLGDLHGALSDFEQALILNPDYELARRNAERVRNLLAGGKTDTGTGKKGETGLVNLSGAKWNWFDPNADATYNVAGDAITIVAPNGNDLWPTYNFNAPRLTKSVSGDFILKVRVQGGWRDNYNGAGLTVYSGKDSVIRFERGIPGVPGGNHVVIFGFVNGRETGRAHIPFPGQDVHLKLERNGNQFAAYASADGVSWTKVGMIKAELPATVEAGLTLVNQHNSNTFRATFSGFELLKASSLPVASGNEVVLFNNGNIYGVSNGPAQPTTFTLRQAHIITSIQNYHWNNGRGATAGTISLRGADGTIYGPWNVITSPGQGGAPNAYWNCAPNVTLPAGVYTVIDSNPATWSYNGQSGGRGFTLIKGIPANISDTGPRLPSTNPRTSSGKIRSPFIAVIAGE